MPYIYQGIYPAAFQFHPYTDEQHFFQMADSNLKAIGLGDMPFVIGEVHYDDLENAAGLAKQLDLADRSVAAVLQWPITRGNENCTGVNTPLPTTQFDSYIKHGF